MILDTILLEIEIYGGIVMSFKVGYVSSNINPKLGYGVMGYYIPRYVKGFLDDLETSAVVLEINETKVVIISVDVCSFTVAQADTRHVRQNSNRA